MRAAVAAEVAHGALINLPPGCRINDVRLAPFISAPKPDGSVRGISDMSWGLDSVNDCTHRGSHIRARLAHTENVLRRIRYMQEQRPGVRVLLSKLDVTRAFRQCAIPIRQFKLAAHRIGKKVMVNTRLMMGATASGDSMAAGISAIRDLLATWYGLFSESYIDDMLLVMYEDEAEVMLAHAVRLWGIMGWPINAKKLLTEGRPETRKTFLGIEIDTVTCRISVPQERIIKLQTALTAWLGGNAKCSPRAISRLAGTLQFISPIIPFGRVFLRSLYRHGYRHSMESRHNEIEKAIPEDVRLDLSWWLEAIVTSNGTASFHEDPDAPDIHIFTDAAGAGWGAAYPALKQYASGSWSRQERFNTSTAHWEGAAVVMACRLWGHLAAGGTLTLHSDSMACVSAFNNMRCTDDRMYLLLRTLSLIQMQSRFRLVLVHIPGVLNELADYLSRHNAPPPDLLDFNRMTVQASKAMIGTLMSSKLRRGVNRVQNQLTPLCHTLGDIVRTSGTQSHFLLSWIPWSALRTGPWAPVDYCTSWVGYGMSATYRSALCADTYQLSELDVM